jgi:DNA-binding MarR family transcriptional regulator
VSTELATTPDRVAHEVIVALSRLKRRWLEAASTDGITPTQRSVLSRLSKEGPATASELAAAERVRPQSMAVTVAALEDAGMVDRTDDPTDGRRRQIALTPLGRAFVEQVRTASREWLAEALDQECTPAELATLGRALAILERVAEA